METFRAPNNEKESFRALSAGGVYDLITSEIKIDGHKLDRQYSGEALYALCKVGGIKRVWPEFSNSDVTAFYEHLIERYPDTFEEIFTEHYTNEFDIIKSGELDLSAVEQYDYYWE